MIGKSLYLDRCMGSSIVEWRILLGFRVIDHENLRTPRHNSNHRRRGRLDREGSNRERDFRHRTNGQVSNPEQDVHLRDHLERSNPERNLHLRGDHAGSNPERNNQFVQKGSGDSRFDPAEGKRSDEVFSENPATPPARGRCQEGRASSVLPESGFRGRRVRRSDRKDGPVRAAGLVLSILADYHHGEEPELRDESECGREAPGQPAENQELARVANRRASGRPSTSADGKEHVL